MYKVAIVEDGKQDRELLVEYLSKYSSEFTITVFSSAPKFLTDYKSDCDIVFMDIDMPMMDGMTAAAKLREIDSNVLLVFVTNLARFAVNGYEVAAFDFIVKPLTYANFSLKMNRVMNQLSTKVEREIVVRSDGNLVRLPIQNILYVEINDHKLIYHTVNRDIVSYGTLLSAEELIADKLFVRCNKCYLVNLRFVSTIEKEYVVVKNDRLLISQPQKASFKRALTNYIGNAGGGYKV